MNGPGGWGNGQQQPGGGDGGGGHPAKRRASDMDVVVDDLSQLQGDQAHKRARHEGPALLSGHVPNAHSPVRAALLGYGMPPSPKKDPPAHTDMVSRLPKQKPKVIPPPHASSSSRDVFSSNSPVKKDTAASLGMSQAQTAARKPMPTISLSMQEHRKASATKSDPDGFVASKYNTVISTPTPNNATAAFKAAAAAAAPATKAAAAAAAAPAAAAPTSSSFGMNNETSTKPPNGGMGSLVLSYEGGDTIPSSLADPPSKGDDNVAVDKKYSSNSNPSSSTAVGKPKSTADSKGPKSASTTPTGNSSKGNTKEKKPDATPFKAIPINVKDEPSQSVRSSRRISINSDPDVKKSEIVSSFLELPTLSDHATLDRLSADELKDLEGALEMTPADGWRDDWSGNLSLVDKEVINPKKNSGASGAAGSFRQALYTWAQKSNTTALKFLNHLFRYVYHLEGTPLMARTILANADKKDGEAMERAFRRVSYDPLVLRQDGWVTAKAPEPVGATGGANRVGDKVRWEGADGVVIAYIHDNDLGDLWRGIWLEEGLESFDMEAEELLDARKKWERRAKSVTGKGKEEKKKIDLSQRRSHRYTSATDFQIKGVEHGIVMAASFSRGARPGVYWPARVMHASESRRIPGSKNRRNSPRQRLDLVFLAPYWNSGSGSAAAPTTSGSRRVVESFSESLSRHGESLFDSGPLFDIESVDVSEEMMKEYPYDGRDGGINIDQLRVAFRFSGLPKAAFQRFLDSHRLALALKTFAQEQLPPRGSDHASAGLFETHPMSVTAPIFPPEVLHLPYTYILSQLPAPPCEQSLHDGEQRNNESVLQLNNMIEAMKPPNCWGQEKPHSQNGTTPSKKKLSAQVPESPYIDAGALLRKSAKEGAKPVDMEQFTKDLVNLKQAMTGGTNPGLDAMFLGLQELLSSVTPAYASLGREKKQLKAQALARSWMFAKGSGEDAIGAFENAKNASVLVDWRRACERIYKYTTHAFSANGYGNGVSAVLTDFRCNQHVTSCGCFERTVRLPAALKAARELGAGRSDNVQLSTSVEKCYVETAENKVLMKAHSAAYLRRMKARCSQIQGDQVVYLTEDSDGNGGEDTKGSRGTWMAAVASVGAAIKAVDMVVEGQCVNVFCATRPPGHHAGRDLHPMKAVSNGFCILNTAACAAFHATTPLSEGGPGLRRVCIIDFDVHHGNGTQDILCSTYDPRFLYVSLHAGGAHVNGLPPSDDFDSEIHSPGGNSAKKGIYPGRCGDSSPHLGVLNIPLGPRVTSHAVGTALINQVTPAVDAFAPDLIILSAGFDAHKNDPLGLGGLSAEDFGHITDVACQLASKCCSGRLISLLEGGYGVPCCRPQRDIFLPPLPKEEKVEPAKENSSADGVEAMEIDTEKAESEPPQAEPPKPQPERPQPSKLLDLGSNLPEDMEDQVPYALQRRLEKCHQEGFIDCIRGHVGSMVKCNKRS